MEKTVCNYKLAVLDKRLKSFLQEYRQNIVLQGDDGEEISYLLENYLQQNKTEEIIFIHATTSFVDRRRFFNSVVLSLLSEYNHRADTLDNLINYTSTLSVLNQTITRIKETLKKDSIDFSDVLNVINVFIEESKKKCTFIIEEFLELENLFPKFYHAFSKFIILQRKCMVILTTSCLKDADKVLSTELNLLFGNFERINLSENAFLDNYVYLKDALFPLNPSPLFISFFINIIGTNIIYYDLITEAIKSNYCPTDEEGSICSILEKALYSKEDYFFQKFMKKIEQLSGGFKDCASVAKILMPISEGYIRKKELLSLKIYDSKEMVSCLQKLIEFNCIENLGNIYKIKDSLFSFWLSHIFKLYFSPPVLNGQKRKILWRRKTQEEISLFKEDFLKDKVKKILELITSFKDDILRTGRKKYKLPLIERTKIISYPDKQFHFIIGEGKEIIFVGVKERNANDSDVFDFIERGSNIKGKGVKKIFISLDRVSASTKLIAKSHRLILWDVNEINDLLRVYNKPIISFESAEQN
jgi:hypothetical protein